MKRVQRKIRVKSREVKDRQEKVEESNINGKGKSGVVGED